MNLEQIIPDLRLVITHPKGSDLTTFNSQIFDFWHIQWSQTFAEINQADTLYSDDYCRQEEAIALFYKEEVVGLMLIDHLDLSVPAHLKHSYFKHHPPEALDLLQKQKIHKTLILSNFAIHSNWRKNYNISNLIIGLCVKRFEVSSFDDLIAYSRNSRKTNNVIYQFGAKPLLENMVIRNEMSDLIHFNKMDVKQFQQHEMHNLIEHIWLTRLQDSIVKINNKKGEKNENYNLLNSL